MHPQISATRNAAVLQTVGRANARRFIRIPIHRRKKKHTDAFIYLVPGAENPSGEHEQVTHGDQTGPYKEREEPEHPLEDRLDADQDEDGQEEEEGSGNRDQEGQVVFCILERERNKCLFIQFQV